MRNVFFGIVSSIAIGALKSAGLVVWNAFWKVVYDAVSQAEREWVSSGRGELKKEFVFDTMEQWIDNTERMNGIQRWAIKRFLGAIVDALIDKLNAEAGKGWGSRVTDLKQYIESKGWFAQLILD